MAKKQNVTLKVYLLKTYEYEHNEDILIILHIKWSPNLSNKFLMSGLSACIGCSEL